MKAKRASAALLGLSLCLSLAACGGDGTEPARAQTRAEDEQSGIAVQTRVVEQNSIASDNTVSGTITSDDQVSLMVAVTAKVVETFAEAGDSVTRGQVLCRLDLDSTLSSYDAANTNYTAAQQSYNDQKRLFDQQIAVAEHQVSVTEQQLAAAEQQLPILEQQIPLAQSQVPLAQSQIPILEQQLSAAQQQQGIAEGQLALVQKNLNDTLALQNIGAASQAEVDQARMAVDQAQMAVDQTKMAVEQARVGIDQAKSAVEQASTAAEQAQLAVTNGQLTVDQARLALENARTQLQQLRSTRTSTLSQLEAGIQSARSSVQQLNTALDNVDAQGNVTAPIDGVLASMNAVKDSYVSSSMPVAVIDGGETMLVKVSVSEALIPKLNIGDGADVSVGALGLSFPAAIRSVEQTANSMTRLYTVSLSVPEGVEGLRSGMFADVTFHTDSVEQAVVVPSEAILNNGTVQFVYIVENGLAKYVQVETGLMGSGVTEIVSGLEPGAELVTVGQSYLSDGAPVRVVEGGQ